MIITALVWLGLIIIPFISLPGYDTRIPKLSAALFFALIILCVSFYRGIIQGFKNKWALIFLSYLLISIFFSPKPDIQVSGVNVQNFWVWQSMFNILAFGGLLISLSGNKWDKTGVKMLLHTMVWCGFIMALYCIVQGFKIDQFFKINQELRIFDPLVMYGTLGTPVVVAPFIGMIIPLALYLKKYIFAGVMALVVVITNSCVAVGALFLMLLFYFASKGKKQMAIAVSILITVIGVYFFVPQANEIFMKESHNRSRMWSQAVIDVLSPGNNDSNALTGKGIGTFTYLYHTVHKDDPLLFNQYQLHNEYLELLYNTGIIGLCLFLCAIGYVWKSNFRIKEIWAGKTNSYRMALLSSFLYISICAGGIFIWQLGAHIFYTIVIVGLLHNDLDLT